MARILGFHPRGPGSIPGVGDQYFFSFLYLSFTFFRKTICYKTFLEALFGPGLIPGVGDHHFFFMYIVNFSIIRKTIYHKTFLKVLFGIVKTI